MKCSVALIKVDKNCFLQALLRSFMIALCLTTPLYAGPFEYRTVEVTGSGSTQGEAIKSALLEAVGQVCGLFVEGEEALNNIQMIIQDNADKSYYSSDDFQQRVATATKGAVKEYTVLFQGYNQQLEAEEVCLSVTCVRVIPSMSNKRRMAVLPFRYNGEISQDVLNEKKLLQKLVGTAADNGMDGLASLASVLPEYFAENLEANLVQSRKFMMLDRRYAKEVASEKNIALNGSQTIEDLICLGTELMADYLVLGNILNVSYEEKERKMPSGRVIVFGQGMINMSFRVVNVKTKQIKYADSIRFQFTDDELKAISGTSFVSDPELSILSETANRVGCQIVEAIYPPQIVGVNGDSVSLNQGGRGMGVGGVYDVFRNGEMMIDPYTGEKLGVEECFVGQIKITHNAAKMARGIVINKTADFADGYICRRAKKPRKQGIRPMIKITNTDDLF